MRPSGAPRVAARLEAPQGKAGHLVFDPPWSLAWVSVRPAQAISGSVKTTAGMASGIEGRFLPGNRLCGHAPLVGSLVGQHGLAGHIPDGKDVRKMGAALGVHANEPLLVRGDPDLFKPQTVAPGAAAHGHQDLVEQAVLRLSIFMFDA